MPIHRLARLSAAACAIVLGLAASPSLARQADAATPEAPRRFNIPAGPLADALRRYATQSGLDLQAEELAAALRRRDHPAQLLTFWGEGHTLLSPTNHRELYLRVLHFLETAFARSRSACPADRSAEASAKTYGAWPAHFAAVR